MIVGWWKCGELAIGGQLLRQHSSPELAQLPTSQRGNGNRKPASNEYLLDGVNDTTRFAITQRGRHDLCDQFICKIV